MWDCFDEVIARDEGVNVIEPAKRVLLVARFGEYMGYELADLPVADVRPPDAGCCRSLIPVEAGARAAGLPIARLFDDPLRRFPLLPSQASSIVQDPVVGSAAERAIEK
jgi:hypothetical protein